jgi:hypothetical protein
LMSFGSSTDKLLQGYDSPIASSAIYTSPFRTTVRDVVELKRAARSTDKQTMGPAPFRTAAVGYDCAAVDLLVDAHMQLVRDDPKLALAKLVDASFGCRSGGYERNDVDQWLALQRRWLDSRVVALQPIEASEPSPAERLAAALDEVQQQIVREAEETRAALIDHRTTMERTHAELNNETYRAVEKLVAEARHHLQRDVDRLLEAATSEARTIIDRSKQRAGQLLLEAEDQRREAEAAVARARELQRTLLGAVDRAQGMIGPADVASATG